MTYSYFLGVRHTYLWTGCCYAYHKCPFPCSHKILCVFLSFHIINIVIAFGFCLMGFFFQLICDWQIRLGKFKLYNIFDTFIYYFSLCVFVSTHDLTLFLNFYLSHFWIPVLRTKSRTSVNVFETVWIIQIPNDNLKFLWGSAQKRDWLVHSTTVMHVNN